MWHVHARAPAGLPTCFLRSSDVPSCDQLIDVLSLVLGEMGSPQGEGQVSTMMMDGSVAPKTTSVMRSRGIKRKSSYLMMRNVLRIPPHKAGVEKMQPLVPTDPGRDRRSSSDTHGALSTSNPPFAARLRDSQHAYRNINMAGGPLSPAASACAALFAMRRRNCWSHSVRWTPLRHWGYGWLHLPSSGLSRLSKSRHA